MPTKATESAKTREKKILEALRRAPSVKGLTAKDVSMLIDMPMPTARWQLELLEAQGLVGHKFFGKSKVYTVKNE